MGYGGESNAKKIARFHLWNHIWKLHWSKDGANSGKILVLAGPEGADVRTLGALGVDREKILAVDTNKDNIENSRRINPGAEYVVGDAFDVARQSQNKFDVIFLDFCQTLSPELLDRVTQLARGHLRNSGILAIGGMYGRESKEALQRISKGVGLVNPPDAKNASSTQRLRFAFLTVERCILNTRLLAYPFAFVSYRSGRRVKKRSVGTPMIYLAYITGRVKRLLGRSAWCLAQDNFVDGLGRRYPKGFVLSSDIGDDADGDKVKKEAMFWVNEGYTSQQIADALNLKRQQIAAWKAWETMHQRRPRTT